MHVDTLTAKVHEQENSVQKYEIFIQKEEKWKVEDILKLDLLCEGG